MTISHYETSPNVWHTKWVACPYCDEPIGEQVSFAQHWPDCPANPLVEGTQ